MQYLITFKSLTYAQRAAQMLGRSGITAAVTRTPKMISREGCGYCIRVSEHRYGTVMQILRSSQLSYSRVFHDVGNGSYREVV